MYFSQIISDFGQKSNFSRFFPRLWFPECKRCLTHEFILFFRNIYSNQLLFIELNIRCVFVCVEFYFSISFLSLLSVCWQSLRNVYVCLFISGTQYVFGSSPNRSILSIYCYYTVSHCDWISFQFCDRKKGKWWWLRSNTQTKKQHSINEAMVSFALLVAILLVPPNVCWVLVFSAL